MAAIRVGYWILDPSFDDPGTKNSELAEIGNKSTSEVTIRELICASKSGLTVKIDDWALSYLLNHSLHAILKEASRRDAHQNVNGEPVPLEAKVSVLKHIDFKRIIRLRGQREATSPQGTDDRHQWSLGLYTLDGKKIYPFILIEMPYKMPSIWENRKYVEAYCWVEAAWDIREDRSSRMIAHQASPDRGAFWSMDDLCSLYVADSASSKRLHLRSIHRSGCDAGCKWDPPDMANFEDEESYRFLDDRSDACKYLQEICANDQVELSITPRPYLVPIVMGSSPRLLQRSGGVYITAISGVPDYDTSISNVATALGQGIWKENSVSHRKSLRKSLQRFRWFRGPNAKDDDKRNPA